MIAPVKRCEACGARRDLTKHHVYPRSLREVWQRRLKQKMAVLCRICHDVVHLPGGLAHVRPHARRDARWQAYKDRITDPAVQAVLGPYRHIIRQLERDCRAVHLGELTDGQIRTSRRRAPRAVD